MRHQEDSARRTLSPLIDVVTAPNPSPLTFNGTNTYLLGNQDVAIIDPGPDLDSHLQVLLQSIEGRTLRHIVITHTHRDHSPLAKKLQERTGAAIVGCAPHRASRDLLEGETKSRSNDYDYVPDQELLDGERIEGEGWTLTAVTTPGHTANHLAFALEEEKVLFSGDHVMGWNTTVVTPPDGSMTDYLLSLKKCLPRDDKRYLPGHGDPIENPQQYVSSLYKYRLQREAAILDRLKTQGPQRIDDIVKALYRGLALEMTEAAALTVFAHLEKLCAEKRAAALGAASRNAIYEAIG